MLLYDNFINELKNNNIFKTESFINHNVLERINTFIFNRIENELGDKFLWGLLPYKNTNDTYFLPKLHIGKKYMFVHEYERKLNYISNFLSNEIFQIHSKSIVDVLLTKNYNIELNSFSFTLSDLRDLLDINEEHENEICNLLKHKDNFVKVFKIKNSINTSKFRKINIFKKINNFDKLNIHFYSYYLSALLYKISFGFDNIITYFIVPYLKLDSKFKGVLIFSTTSNHIASETFLSNLKFISYFLLSQDLYEKIKEDKNKVITHSTKSAIAAIMSRNMSHNLGSHVLSYLKSSLQDVPTALSNKLVVELSEIEYNKNYELHLPEEWIKKVEVKEKTINKIEAPFLLGIGRFIAYLQERQDFIATISTDYIPTFSSINFKEFIYDEFNWDYKIIRHKELQRYNARNILLDNIARSEHINRERLHIFFHDFNGVDIYENIGDKEHKDLEFLRTINVDLPGGSLGRQAFFSILENIIRNAAKHGNQNKKDKTSFVLTKYSYRKLKEDTNIKPHIIKNLEYIRDKAYRNNDEFKNKIKEILGKDFTEEIFKTVKEMSDYALILTIKIKDYDNKPESEYIKDYDNKPESEYYEVQITDNNGNGNKAIKKVINALKEPYIDPTSGQLLESNKGIKEMRISAAWLQSREITSIIDENEPEGDYPPIIQVHRETLKGETIKNYNRENGKVFKEFNSEPTNLSYKFFLRKTQKLAFITENKNLIKANDKNGNEIPININNEFEILTYNEFTEQSNKNFNLIVVESGHTNIEDIKKISPVRLLEYDIKIKTPASDSIQNTNVDCLNSDLQSFNKYDKPNRAEIITELHAIYLKLYRKWIEAQVVEKGIDKTQLKSGLPIIAISDEISKDNIIYKDHISAARTNKIKNQSIIYRTHNDNIEQFTAFRSGVFGQNNDPVKVKKIQNIYNKSLFIEGITGHNSTSRLIRNEKLDEFWALKMIESALTNVCLIDERIWERVRKGERDNAPLKEVFHKKNIHIFTIMKPENIFEVIDGTKQKLGQIELDEKPINTQLENLKEDDFYGKLFSDFDNTLEYDFVIIHQGILDKLYDFANKNETKENEVTMQDIFDNLSANIKAKYRYIVHSGRSKPDKIPNGVSFILFSTLLKVLDDSKFSLCQLLYSSRLLKDK